MIMDRKVEYKTYLGISERIDKALKLMAAGDFSKQEPGRYDVCDGVYYNLFEADTKPYTCESKWETHDDYIDIHIMLRGRETFCFRHRTEVKEVEVYNPGMDATFYNGDDEGGRCTLTENDFIICFPSDAHCPLVVAGDAMKVKKLVFKVKV